MSQASKIQERHRIKKYEKNVAFVTVILEEIGD